MKNKIIFILMIVASLLYLTSCNFDIEDYIELDSYIDHLLEKEEFENSIKFLQDEYIFTVSDRNTGLKVYLEIYVEDLSYLEKITYSIDDESLGTISEDGVISWSYPYLEGETYIRARIEELKIETIAKVSFWNVPGVIYDLSLNNVVIDKGVGLQLLSSSAVDHTKYDITFLGEGLDVEEDRQDCFYVTANVIGQFPYYVTLKGKEQVLYKGVLTARLNESVVENRVRALLNKSATEIITKEEMATIENIDDGSIFVNQNMSSMEDFNYFPLTKTLNLSGNKIRDALIELDNLEKLNLSNNNINNLQFLCDEYNITELKLSNNVITNFDDSKFPDLRILYINNNSLTKNFVLNGNSNLIYVNVNDCALNSLTINVKDNLTHILAAGNNLSDLSSFSGCQLKVLDIANNKVSSLAFLATDMALEELYLGGNPVSTSELAYISKDVRKNIFRLNLSITGSKDYSVLQQFIIDCAESLVWLQIYGIGLTSVNWITQSVLPKLEYIKVSHNSITDYSTLEYIKVVVKNFDDYRQDVE